MVTEVGISLLSFRMHPSSNPHPSALARQAHVAMTPALPVNSLVCPAMNLLTLASRVSSTDDGVVLSTRNRTLSQKLSLLGGVRVHWAQDSVHSFSSQKQLSALHKPGEIYCNLRLKPARGQVHSTAIVPGDCDGHQIDLFHLEMSGATEECAEVLGRSQPKDRQQKEAPLTASHHLDNCSVRELQPIADIERVHHEEKEYRLVHHLDGITEYKHEY